MNLDNKKRKRVLFVGTVDYNLTTENATLKKKWEGVSRDLDVYVLARGQTLRARKYNAEFYLTPKIFGKIGMPLWLFITFFRGLFIIIFKRIDVIVSQSPLFDGFVSAWLKIITRRELIIEIHGDWINNPFLYFRIPFEVRVKKILKAVGRFSLGRADKVRVISRATRKLAEDYARGQKIYKFPTFTDIDIFKAETDISYEPVIMYAGWLYRLKGIHFLVEAFSRLQDKYPKFKLLLVGEGPFRTELEGLVKKLKVRNIEFTGHVSLEVVKNYMRNCTCFVLPSLSEGLGRVLIEAAMLKKPSIGTNVDGIPDIIKDGETGFLFESGNVGELTEKLDKIMGNPELVRKMGIAGRRFVEDKFSTEKYFRGYEEMIK